jgi:mRNA interferase MazF
MPAAKRFGEVVLCAFPYTSGTTSKTRPALVLFDLGQDVIICRVTSVLHTGPLDIMLFDWQSAGLLKPSVARFSRVVTAEKSILLRSLGALSARELGAVRRTWNQHMQL